MAEWLQVEVNRRQPLEAKLTAPEAVNPMLFTQLNRLLTRAFLDKQNQDKVFKLAEYDEEISNDVHWELSSRFLVPPILEDPAQQEITIHPKMLQALKMKTKVLSIEKALLLAQSPQHDQKAIGLSTPLRDRTADAEHGKGQSYM
ncbi:hypothetical protein MJO29_010199 [Puccinia striiformis f. sp. tritici]|nr:hypothetical protein MJO29_010199 [Puccinia striiformis f. sp. tritici]